MRFYLFRAVFLIGLLPFYWMAKLIRLWPMIAIRILRTVSFFLAIAFLYPNEPTFGLIRVVLWAGPLSLLSSVFGFFGYRGLWFKLLALSIVFPGLFGTKMGLTLWCLFAGVQYIGQRVHGIWDFVICNFYICLLFSISNTGISFFSILISPFIELTAYLHNISFFIELMPWSFGGLDEIFLNICQSSWYYRAVSIDEKWTIWSLYGFSSFLLLFFAPKVRSPLGAPEASGQRGVILP